MKTKTIIRLYFAFLLFGVLASCEKAKEFTVEDQPVTGDLTYVRKSFIPLTFDTVTMQPLSASITMEGTGTISDMGKITMLSSFKFDFVTGKGTDFVTTYTGESAADNYAATGSSQMQQDGTIVTTESFSNGKGKFSKMKGGGDTKVVLAPDGSSGTGAVTWKVTY